MAVSAAEALANFQPDSPKDAVAQGLRPETADPDRQVSIKEAWQQTVQTSGPVTYDQDPSALDANAAAKALGVEVANDAEKLVEEAEEKPKAEPKKAKTKAEPKPEESEDADDEEAAADAAEEERDVKFTAKERREFIDQRRKLRERFERNERAQEARWTAKHRELQAVEQRISAANDRLGPLMRAAQAAEAGDFDGIAKGLGEFLGNKEVTDWNTLNSEALKAVQSPVYKKMRELERRQEEAMKERERQYQEQQRSYAEQQRAQEIASWKRGAAEELAADDDPAISGMVEARPELVDAIFNIQNQHYHETRGDVLSARDAAVKLLENVQRDFKLWSDFFSEHGESDIIRMLTGSQPAPKKKAAVSTGIQRTETSERRGTAKAAPKNVPQSQTAQASALGNLSEKDLIKITAQKMQEDFQHLR